MQGCINCGTCTAVCPAASVSNYDPREIMDLVQEEDEESLRELLSSNSIWLCGECLSCKTRCPRDNTPCYVIQALRALSIESGLFRNSEEGLKQKELVDRLGRHMLDHGYCIYFDDLNIEMYPEQGPVWEWLRENRHSILKRLGCSYQESRPGSLRDIPQESISDLRAIFRESGAIERFQTISEEFPNYNE